MIAFPGRKGPQAHTRMLARHGYGVLLFDRRGEGESEGDPTSWGWGNEKDIKAAIAFLQRRPDVDPDRIGGLGLSVGGEMMIQAAAETSALKAVASEGAGMRSVRETIDTPSSTEKWLVTPFKAVETAATAVFHDQAPPASLGDLVAKVAPRPLLLMYSGKGQGGEVQLNPEFFRAAGQPKALWKIAGAGHTGGIRAQPDEYERRVIGFFDDALLDNRRTQPRNCSSKPPGMKTLKATAGSSVRFAKSCVTPAGTRRHVPLGASTQVSPTRNDIVPSVTRKISSLASWWCAPGPVCRARRTIPTRSSDRRSPALGLEDAAHRADVVRAAAARRQDDRFSAHRPVVHRRAAAVLDKREDHSPCPSPGPHAPRRTRIARRSATSSSPRSPRPTKRTSSTLFAKTRPGCPACRSWPRHPTARSPLTRCSHAVMSTTRRHWPSPRAPSLPAYQRQGAGSASIRAALDAARGHGESLVLVLGHPEYYPRFGFTPASGYGIRPPFDVPDEAMMALVLDDGRRVPQGTIRYAPPFGV